MADVGFRDFGPSLAPSPRREGPESLPIASATRPPEADLSGEPAVPFTGAALFGCGPGERADNPELSPVLLHVAELAAHGQIATPLTIGLVGGPGSGKSTALTQVSAAVRELAGAAGSMARSPFLARVHVQDVDAATLDAATRAGADPLAAVAAVLHGGLRRLYPELARTVAQTGRDPHVVLREVGDKLDAARRRLDNERRALDEVGSRRARLAETVLFEASGSRLDAYARANRSAIESRLAAFGVGGEPMRSFKELVQYAAGPGGRTTLATRAVWAYRGQFKLVAAALVLLATGVGLGVALDHRDGWLGWLRSGAQAGTAVAGWFEGHMGLLASARTAAFALAALALAANCWRALRFLLPVFKGARLLGGDLDLRRRDLDGLFAHSTKRVDGLERDVENLTRQAAEAERRAEAAGGGPDHDASISAASPTTGARDALAALAAALAGPGGAGNSAPQRIVLALDGFEALSPERARPLLDAVRRAAGPGTVVLVALDPGRLDPDGRGGDELARWLDATVSTDAAFCHHLVARALGRAPAPSGPKLDASSSALDAPLEPGEADLLSAVAPLAGSSPRATRRFLAAYGLARLQAGPARGALAFALAAAGSEDAAIRAASEDALARADAARPFALAPAADARLRAGLAAAARHDGRHDGQLDGAAAVAAARAARRFTLPDRRKPVG